MWWCVDQVIAIGSLLEGPDEIQGVTRLDELWPNLRSVVDWACATGDLRLATALIGPVAAEIYLRSRSEIGDWAERILAVTAPDDEDVIVFGLTWAARRYMRNLDLDGYERLVGRYGEPDRPMIRYARAFLTDDYEGRAAAAARAVTELRRRGEHYVADLNELVAVGLTWLMFGRLEKHDALVTVLVERFRSWPADRSAVGIDVSRHLGVGAGPAPRGRPVLRGCGRRRRSRPHADAEEPPGRGRPPSR